MTGRALSRAALGLLAVGCCWIAAGAWAQGSAQESAQKTTQILVVEAEAGMAAESPGAEPDPVVRVLAGAEEGRRPTLRPLTRDLEAVARAVAPRLPLTLASLAEKPLEVVVEDDHLGQARHTEEVGEAVPGSTHDLHLVLDPADDWVYRIRLARAMLRRSGLDRELPPWLAEGAALWLLDGGLLDGGLLDGELLDGGQGNTGAEWYGRPWREWLPVFAAAGALPRAEELLAAELPADAPTALWVPVAAEVIGSLEGETLRAKVDAWKRLGEASGSAGSSSGGSTGARSRLAAILDGLQQGPLSPRPAPPAAPGATGGMAMRGISLAMQPGLEVAYHAPVVEPTLARLADLGADTVSIMPFAYQPRVDSPELHFLNDRPSSETDIGTLHAARRARSRGFRVLWKPHVWVGGGGWPGDIEMTSEEDWAAWWRSYRNYILHHAMLARRARAEIFSIGVELTKTQQRRREWEELIDAVRHLYPGWVTYSGNWYGGMEEVPFWNRLDLIGIDAYFPLADSADVTPEELDAGAREVVRRLGALARKEGKGLLLTEVGFAAHRAAWMAPHEEGGDFDAEDQAASYRALLGALDGEPWLRGVFFWKVFIGAAPSTSPSPDFRFLGRPAESEVRRFFRPASSVPGRDLE